MRQSLALALCLAGPVAAQDLAPEVSPRPEDRPAEEAVVVEDAVAKDEALSPGQGGQRDLLVLAPDEMAACLAALDDLGVVYREVDPIVPQDDADCGIVQPVEVTEIAPGVAVLPAAQVRCPTALSLAEWVRDFVLPASARLDDRGALTAIESGSGYVCRRRNNQPDGKLSEHAFGNAFDVMGFQFAEGPPIKVEPREADGTMAEAFQDAVRASACLEFSTVLGPGSDAFHDDHLHFDIVERSRGYRLCEQGGGAD